MFFNSKKVIGLDIGTSSIKMAEMDLSGKGAQLISFGFAPTPPNSVAGGEITDISSVGLAIQTLTSEIKTKRKKIATAMWGTAVIVKKITIPRMDKKLVRDQIRFEAEQYIPFDINNISLSHHILSTSSSPDTMDLLLIAAQNELVSQYTQVIEIGGLNCSILDVSGFALANSFEMNYGKFPGEIVGLLNFGASITNFVVLQNGEVIFCRDIPVGGANYTNEIHKSMGVTIHEAEALKLSAVSRREVPDDVHAIISATNEAVTEEIRSSLDFLSATTNGISLTRCYYTGGSSTTSGLVDTVSRVTNTEMQPFNPFMRVKTSKKFSPEYLNQISAFAGVVTGLAMRSTGDAND